MMTDQRENPPSTPSSPVPTRSWLSLHRWGIIWTALLAVIVLVQWPMLKGLFYRVSGSPAPNDGIPWRTDFNAALAEAKQSGKPVLLDFYASWCPPCQVMKHDVWPDAKVREAVTAGYIPVAVDVDNNQGLATRYGVFGIPSVLIVDAEGKVLKQGNFMSSSSLLGFLARRPGDLVTTWSAAVELLPVVSKQDGAL